MDASNSLTGIWQGAYSYDADSESVDFVATLIESGAILCGGIHEIAMHGESAGSLLLASVDGSHTGSEVSFVKSYEGRDTSLTYFADIAYRGTLSGDATEIEGEWQLPSGHRGRFVMTRPRREAREIEEKVEEPSYL